MSADLQNLTNTTEPYQGIPIFPFATQTRGLAELSVGEQSPLLGKWLLTSKVAASPFSYEWSERKIVARNPQQVQEFLSLHSGVVAYLWFMAWPQLVKYFGRGVTVVLEVLHYPQEQVGPELVAWIQCPNDVDAGMHRFDAFEGNWLLDHLPDPRLHLNFNLEFK